MAAEALPRALAGRAPAAPARAAAAPGAGFRLAAPLELLDARALRAALPRDAAPRVAAIDVLVETDSTNRMLLERAPPAPGMLDVCIAEYQHAGRGRRGRAWRAPL